MLTKRQEQILIDHFKYSVNDISSYDELTESEKKLMSEEEFNELYGLCKEGVIMTDAFKACLITEIEKAGFSIVKLVEDTNPTCSDPIRIYLENVPSNWNPDAIDDLTEEQTEIPAWYKDDGIEDSFHSFMNEHFGDWEIVPVDGIEDNMPDGSWMLHGYLKQ